MASPAAANQQNQAPDGDYLGYGIYADTLWARIARALDKDADGNTQLGDDPLVVGIFGEWGAGKSKLLSLVRAKALAQLRQQQASRDQAPGFSLTVPVFFQPWKYEHEPHLHVPLVMHVTAALKDALKSEPGLLPALKHVASQANVAARTGAAVVHKGAAAAAKLFPYLQTAVGSLSVFGTSIQLPDELGEWLEDTADATSGAPEALEKLEKKHAAKQADAAAQRAKRQITHTADGLYFYRINEYLQKITRPGKDEALEADLSGAKLSEAVRINFVIFIDDLDRCLPEKAVEVLELIKTVFNVESFAFVLALDEEVIERGIGHRYMAYHLAGKKPDMPITGFEYLEKIVHLPFRLPALTRAEAKRFMHTYEEQVAQPDAALQWFTPPTAATPLDDALETGVAGGLAGRNRAAHSAHMDLTELALDAFDVYVPRKLIRLIELMQAVAAVAHQRGRPLTGHAGGEVDVRVVLALLMIQLFQPEMYRLMRRRINAFPALLSAFPVKTVATGASSTTATLAGSDVSDIDLYDWVGHGSSTPASTHASSGTTAAGMQEQVARIQKIGDPSVRALAQQVRLPLVNQLVEYRGAQRHGFDLLKLVQSLAKSLYDGGGDPDALVFRPYISLLGQVREVSGGPVVLTARAIGSVTGNVSKAPASAPDPRPRFAPRDLAGLYSDWQSPEPSVQANLAGNRELPEGQVLETQAAQALLALATDALKKGSAAEQTALRNRLAQGVVYLAPFLSRTDGPAYWALLGAELQGNDQEGQPIRDMQALAQRERWMDVRSTLRADPRWSPQRFGLPAQRFAGHDSEAEPIPGFVRVSEGPFSLGSKDQWDNRPTRVRIDHDFFIARYLTTVDQYAAFVNDEGYFAEKWWDSQGIAWRDTQWASKTNHKELRKWLDARNSFANLRPRRWEEQLVHGSRPMSGINWFEARAYLRWLSAQLSDELNAAGLPGYQACLPVEAQWERAARAQDTVDADSRAWPWGDKKNTAALRANIDDSNIGRPSVVGLFEPNPLGVADLAGNLREWQGNLYQGRGIYKAGERIPLIAGQAPGGQEPSGWLLTDEDLQKSALPAMRGGSFNNSADNARAAFRDRAPPDFAIDFVGLRVVLSFGFSGF